VTRAAIVLRTRRTDALRSDIVPRRDHVQRMIES
jgi:hypothetical protein